MAASATHQIAINKAMRLIAKLLPTTGGVDFRVAGKMHRFVPHNCSQSWQSGNGFLLGPKTSNAAYIMGINERAFLNLILKHMHGNGVILNVGANIGYTALWLAKAVSKREPVQEFLALEPEPLTFQILQKNLELNRLPVSAECVAASDSDGTTTLYSTGEGDGAASFEQKADVQSVDFEVRLGRLDELLGTERKQSVRGLVIDVEGHAGGVLRGAPAILQNDRPFVAAELHNDRELSEVEACLSPMGYELSDEITGVWGTHKVWAHRAPPAA